MATKQNSSSFWSPILFMIVLSLVLTFILAWLNQNTYAVIKSQEDLAVQKSILYALDVPYKSDTEVQKIIAKDVKKHEKGSYSWYEYTENGTVTKYAFPITGKALWGTVEGFGATDKYFQKLLGIDFTKQSETPGLGGRITEEWYKQQFRGIAISGNSPYVIYKPASGGNIDAVTGATLTSNSVRDMVNTSIDAFKKMVEGESK